MKARQFGFACAILVDVSPAAIFGADWPRVEGILVEYDGEIQIDNQGRVSVAPHGSRIVGIAHANAQDRREYREMMKECASVSAQVAEPGFWVEGNCCA